MDSSTREGGLQVADTLIILFLSTTCILTIGANLIVLGTIGFTRKLHSVSSVLVANMALCDLGVGVTAMPLVLAGLVNGRWLYSKVACQVTAVLTSVLCMGSVWSLAAVALDRYFAITYCLRYSTWSPWKYGGGLIACIWIQAFFFGLSPLLSWGGFEVQDISYVCVVTWTNSLIYGISVCLVCYVVPFLIMGYCYLRIILVARQHARRIGDITAHSDNRTNVSTTGAVAAGAMFSVRRLSMLSFPGNVDVKSDFGSFNDNDCSSGTSSSTSASPIRRDVRATLRLVGLVGIYLITWLSYILIGLYNAIQGYFSDDHPYIVTLAYCIALANSGLNPFLYALLSKHFRSASKRLFQSRKSSVVEIRNINQDCISTYASFLRNLRTPAFGTVNGTSGFQESAQSGSPDTSSSLAESRPSSVVSDCSQKRKFLDVPRQSFGDTYGFLLPNAVRDSDDCDARQSRGKDGGMSRGKSQMKSSSATNTIGDYVYDCRNKANIQIKLDLVSN